MKAQCPTVTESLPRVLIIASDTIGRQMAGSGVRYWHFARVIGAHQPVTLAVPKPTDLQPPPGVTIVAYGHEKSLVDLIADHDVVVAQHLPYLEADAELLASRKIVIDLYAPWILEKLEYARIDPERGEPDRADDLEILTRLLSLGDFFICASERQRDYWLGALTVAGRLDLAHVRHDPDLRGLIDVVALGLPEDPPQRTGQSIRDRFPAISPETQIVLWNGGIWNWLDPLTAIRATGLLVDQGHELALVFMGVRSPGAHVAEMRIVDEAETLARDLDLLDTHVFFNDWVPYEHRASWLLDADCVITLHSPTIESRFAYRTRLLDALWTGTPIVGTQGDVLAGIVEDERIGVTAPPNDVEAVAAAIQTVLDPGQQAAFRQHIQTLATRHTWPAVLEPLVRYCRHPQAISPRRGTTAEREYIHKLERLYTETADYARHLESVIAATPAQQPSLPRKILDRLRRA